MHAENKLRRLDGRTHPFEKGFYERVKQATKSAKLREANAPIRKYKPEHIVPKWDGYGFGMWNTRLEIWCKGEQDEYPVFKTEKQAVDWYFEQI